MRQLVAAAECAQHIAGLQAGRGAGRARRHRQPLDTHDQRLALDIVERDVEVVRHAARQVAVDEDLLDVRQAVQQALVQHRDAGVLFGHFLASDLERQPHADDLVHRQRTRTHAALVATAVHLRLDADARLAAHVQRAHALRPVALVRGQAHQINRQCAHVDLDLAGGLRGIDVEDHAVFAADRADCRDVLDHANLVVHEHHRGEDRVRADGGLELVQIKQTIGLHVEVGRLEALALQFAHGVEHGLVLGLHRDDVLAARLVELRSPLQGQVVGLGRARGPDDLTRIRLDQTGHLRPRLLDRLFRFPAPGVRARSGIAEVLAQPGNHRVHHARIDRSRRAVVHVDREVRGHVHVEPGRSAASARMSGAPQNLW